MVHQELEVKSQAGFNHVVRFCAFCLSAGTLYLMVIWTLDLSQVEVGDLPVVSVLDADFKRKPPDAGQKIIENSDLSINSLRGNEDFTGDHSGLILGTFEETLTSEEKPVPLSMKKALENSIAEALNSLAKDEIISKEHIYQVYLGSFNNRDSALDKLMAISKIKEPSISESFAIVSGVSGSTTSYRLETVDTYSFEKARQFCNHIVSHKLDCKVIGRQ